MMTGVMTLPKQEVHTSCQPTSDPEKRKEQITVITKITADKPKTVERINQTVSRGRELQNNDYLTPEHKERINRECKDIEVNWNEFTSQLDDAKTSIESGEKDLQDLVQYRVDYDVIITWIKTNEKRLQVVKDDDGKDRESIEKQRVNLRIITDEFPVYKIKLHEVIIQGKRLSNTPSLPDDEREEMKKQSDDLNDNFNALENDVSDANKKLDDKLKNLDRYESWQQKTDDLNDKLNETKESLDKFDIPTSNVDEREKQKRFLNEFNKKKPAQQKAINDAVREGQNLIKEDIVPTDKREKVELDLQSLPETWDNLVAKADENKKTIDSSLQDAVQLNKWRNDYNVVLLWVEKAEEKQSQREDDGVDDLDKLKKQRKRQEADVKELVKYEPKIAPLLAKGDTISQSKVISPDDAKSVEDDGKALKERFDKLKVDETDRKQKLDDKIQWLTDYKQYKTDSDAVNLMLTDTQNKLESYEKPTSNKAERDKQASFINQFIKVQVQNGKTVDKVVEQGEKLANAPGIPEDKGDEIKEETKTMGDTWRIIVLKVEELQKIVTSGIQNITELSDWRKEYTVVIKWIEMNEKKLAAQGEPGDQYKDLSNKCTTLEEMVNLLLTYETRVVMLLEKGDLLAKETSIDEADRKKTEDDTNDLRERWDKLKTDEQDKKKRFDDQKGYVEDYRDWKDNVDELKALLDNTEKELDACELPTSDRAVREKQMHFIKVFSDHKDKHQGRVDSVATDGERLLKENPVAQKADKGVRDTINNTRNSWNNILQRFGDVEQSVTSGAQDIVQLEEWRVSCSQLNKSVDNARQEIRNLKKTSKDPARKRKQKDEFEVISNQMAGTPDQVNDLSGKADYLITTSSISPKDKDKVSKDLEQLKNTWNNYENEKNSAKASFDVEPTETVEENIQLQKTEALDVQGTFQDVDDLFQQQAESPKTVDYSEWKDNVGELERILDQEDGKFDPKSDIEKDYANLERLAQETKVSGATVDDDCKPKLSRILSDGNFLVNSKQLEPTDEAEVTEKMASLQDKTERVDTAVSVTRMKVRDAALDYFNEGLNDCSVNVNKMQETAKTLRPPANDLPGVRVQIAFMKSLQDKLVVDGGTVQEIEDKVNKMEDAGILPRDGFAGTLNDRCDEVRKEQQNVNVALEEVKPKLHRALLNQLNRTQKAVSKWLKLCEKKDRNIDFTSVKDLNTAREECLKLKQAKAEFDKGEPEYVTLKEVHKEAVDDGVLFDKKAADFEKQVEELTSRHDELKKRLEDKNIELLEYVRQFTGDVLNSAEEKLEEHKTWLAPEEPAENFSDAKAQQDKMMDRESTIKERAKDVIVRLGPLERIAGDEILPLPEATTLQRRVAEVKTRFNTDILAAEEKSQKLKEGYGELLKKEIEKRKVWLDDHKGLTPETDAEMKNFKDFDEFKVKYGQNKDFVQELDDNSIEVLIEEANKIDGLQPELKEELTVLNERWDKIHDATKDKTDFYDDLMTKWETFRERQLTLLNWIDEKDAQTAGDQVNLADEDEVAKHIKKLNDVKEEAEIQGASQEKKVKEASEDLIGHLGEDSPAAVEINKQVQEVDSLRQSLVQDMSDRIEKIESSEQKTRDLYDNMDDVTTWLDTTENLIDTYEYHEKQSDDQAVPKGGEIHEGMVHVVEDILIKRKEIPERELQLNSAVDSIGQLVDQLDETTLENAQVQVEDMKNRWDVVTQRVDVFCNRDIPEIEIAEIKAEHLYDDSLDETDLNSVVPLDTWREKVRKVNLLLKYVERLIGVNVDRKMDYPSIRILASNTKEASSSITSYCKPRAEIVSKLGYNIIDDDPHNIDVGEEITTTIVTLNKKIELSESGATILKLKVHDIALDYFKDRLNSCEIALETEEGNASELVSTTKPDLKTAQEQMVLLNEGREKFKKNQKDYENVVDELQDKKISEFLAKEEFQGTLGDKSNNIKRRREAVSKKLSESETRIHRDLISHLTDKKKAVAKWLTSCEKQEKTVNVEPSRTHDPVAEYKKLKILRDEMHEGEPRYDDTVQLNTQLITDHVLEGRKASNSEKEIQSFAARFASLGKRFHDKNSALYTILLNLTEIIMDEVKDDISEADTKVEQTVLAARYPQVKQDFQNAKIVRNEVDEVCEKSKDSLKKVLAIIALDVFNDDDKKIVDDRRNELKGKNAQLEEKSDEKFDNFAKQYNEIIEKEVKNRKMWLDENESWMNINDNDVDDLTGFSKKLDEQKIFQEELEPCRMEGLLDEARGNEELSPDTRCLIYDLDDKWNNLNDWSEERLAKLNTINIDWKKLREQEKELLHNIDDHDARLKLISSPVNLSDKDETEDQRDELKDLQSDAQELGLNVAKIQKCSNDLIKLVGPDSTAGKLMEKKFNDINTCHVNLCNDTLTRLKKLDDSERKTKALYDHMDDISIGMDESESILKSLNDELKVTEEKKDTGKEGEINRNDDDGKEDGKDEIKNKKDKSADLNKFVDQISLRLGERPEEKARVERAKELEASLGDNLSDEAKDVLQKKVEDFDNRWEDLSKKMDQVVKDNEAAEEPVPIKAFQVSEVESAMPEDQTVDYDLWKGDAAEIDESMLKSQTALQAYDVDVKDYSSLMKSEAETQDIIDRMNREFKPKLMTLRSSGEKIPGQNPDITSDQVDDIVNSTQKNLEGLQSALELRKLRLHDSAVQHMNERILDCEAKVGEEQVKLQMLTPVGKDLDTVLDQLSALQENEKIFHTNQVEFEEVQVHLNELKQNKILTSPEFQEEFQDDCKKIAIERAQVLKQTRDRKNRLYRAIVNVFDARKKEIAKWLKNCEKKEKEIANDVQDLDESLTAVKKVKDAEEVIKQLEPDYHETVELAKTVTENEILIEKKAKDAENEMKNLSIRYNHILEDVQKKKNNLYKTIHELLNDDLKDKEAEIKKGEDIVQIESQPDDPTATHEELANLQVVVNTSDQLQEDSGKLFDKANALLSADICPQDDKKELRRKVIYLDKRAYELPDAAKDKYEQVYSVYLSHLTKLIQLRTEWISDSETRMEHPNTTDASDISDLENKFNEHEEFEKELKKNSIRSVLEQIRDTSEVDPEVPITELQSLEKRWEVLNTWCDERKIFLETTLQKWNAFRQEELALVDWIDKKDDELKELDNPVNLADENAVQERLQTLRNLQTDVNQHSPNLHHFKHSGQTLLEDLQPETEGAQHVNKQIEDFHNCWTKLEKDIADKIEKLEKSNRTIKAIHSYMDIVTNWLDDTDGKLSEVDSTRDRLRRVSVSPLSVSGDHSVDGGPRKEPGDEVKDGRHVEGKPEDEPDNRGGPRRLSEEEKEEIRGTLERMKEDIKVSSRKKGLNKARIERARNLVIDIHDDLDEDGIDKIEERIRDAGERYEQIDTRLDFVLQEEKPQDTSSEPELVTVDTTLELHSSPPEELPGEPQETAEGPSEAPATDAAGVEKTPVEPYSGKVTLDLKEWRIVASTLRDFLHRMQMNIRDVDSKNYEEMRQCEVDTKICLDAMETYGKPCLNDLVLSANGMFESPEYTEDEKNEIRSTLESLTVGAQFVNYNIKDQIMRLYNALMTYQNEQKKQIQRWLTSFSKKSKAINEDVAGLEASDAEYKKVQRLNKALGSGEPTFLHYKELSKRMIQNRIFPEKKKPDIEKDIANFTTSYDNIRTETDRKDKRLYVIVVKSISLPLESIEMGVTEGESWTEPEELSDKYEKAKEQLDKMKLSVFVIETLHTRSAKVLKETEALVSEHRYLTPEDKQSIIERVHDLSPRTDALPATAVNKYKRMNREFLVLIESEVESRDAWITKNEPKMTLPPAGDVQDLEGFLQLKEAHDEFLQELKSNEMSELVNDSEGAIDVKKATVTRIRELQTRWSALLDWGTKRTVYLNTVIANWQGFRQHEVTATAFIDRKEHDLQGIEGEKLESDEVTKDKVEQLENLQGDTRENSLEIWKLQRQSFVVVKSIGEDAPASKKIEEQTKNLIERNDKLSQDISVGINQLEGNQHKAHKMQELMNSVNNWTASTTVFLDDFNDIAAQLAPSDVAKKNGDEKVKDESQELETTDYALAEDDAEKAKEREEKIQTANELIQKIAGRRVDIGEYQASVDRINELHVDLPSETDRTSDLDVQVGQLNTNWTNFNIAVDKIAWTKIPGVNSLQAITYILHDMKINKARDNVAGVETLEQWKEKVSDLENSVGAVEANFKQEKDMKKEYGEIEAVIKNIQETQEAIDEQVLPKLEVIRLAGVKLCSPSEESVETISSDVKTDISTTVLSLHEKIENTQTVIQLQRLRLDDIIHEYFHERIRSDKRLLDQEQAENKRLFPVSEDIETIIQQLNMIKESEKTFNTNDDLFKETQEQFNELNNKQRFNDPELVTFMTASFKNLEIQRETVGKLYLDIEQKLRRNLINKFNTNKTKFSKWTKQMEKKEKTVDPEVEGVEKALTECTKLESIAEKLPIGEELKIRVVMLLAQINVETIWSSVEMKVATDEVSSLTDRQNSVKKSIEDNRNTLQTKVKAGLEQTFGVAEKAISEAEAWDKPDTLSDELEKATAEIQQSMENVTNVNNMYTQTMQSLKRPQEIAESGVLPDEDNTNILNKCRDLTKRVGRLPAVVLKNHKSLFEAFLRLLHDVVDEREQWISQNEANVMVSFVSIASLDDLKNKIQENKEFVAEIQKHDMATVIVELEKMSDPDFKLKATSKDLQSRLFAMEEVAKQREIVLLSILNQWEAMRTKLKELLDWIDLKDLKLKELKEQVNLGDEDEVKEELKELKLMQTQMEDEYPEVGKLKKMGEELKKILGNESEANALVDEQVKDFLECWENLGNDIQEKIRKLESSERQLSTMHRYMDNTQDWIDDITEILDQYATNERRLQGLPPDDKPKDSEGGSIVSEADGQISEDEPKIPDQETKDSDDEPKISGEKADVSEAEPEIKELDEDEKEKLKKENKNLVEEFVIKRQSRATCQAFVDWAGELGQQASDDLDDESKDVLKIRIEKFKSTWDVFTDKVEGFSQNNAEDIKFIEFQLAEQQSEDLPESVTFEEWKTEVSNMDDWFNSMDQKCSLVNIKRDSDSLKKGEQDTKTILTEFNNEGKPRFNKIIVLGRRLVDSKSQTPEEEQEITITITKFTKKIIEVERVVELHRIRTLETIVDYCKERLDGCESAVERDEVNMNQLTPSGSTPEAVHEQIVLLKVCEDEIPQHDEEFVEIQTYITEAREPGFISYETQSELEKSCKVVEKRRNDVDKQVKESHNRLYRAMVSFFEQKKKMTLRFLGNCERKERQVKPDVKELKDSKNEYIKVKEVRTEFDQGQPNFMAFIEVYKLVLADEILDSTKSTEFEEDVNTITGRVEQVDKILHEQETKLYTTLLSTLTVLLDSIESTLSDGRSRITPEEVISTYFKTAKKQMDETKVMARDIQVIHLATNKQLELGEDVKKANLLGPEDADTLELRLSDLTKKSTDLQEAAQDKERRVRVEYVTTFKTELQRCSQWITFLELRVEKSLAEAEDYPGYKVLKDEHIHFEEDLKVYDLNMLVKEVDKIDELEPEVKQELTTLGKRWKKLLKWSEERNLRLTKIVALWSNFREEETAVLNWIDKKGDQLKVADQVNMADEEAIKEQLDIFKRLTPEREEYVKRSVDVENMGLELKRIVGDKTMAGESIHKQLGDLDQVFNELIKQIVQKIAQLESGQARLQSMAEEMKIVNTWCNETEVLLDEYDVMEKKLQDPFVGKSDPPEETGDQEGEKESKKEKRARIKEEKAELREDMIDQIEKLSVKYEKLSVNDLKVKRVNTAGNELKGEVDDRGKQDIDEKLKVFNERFNAVSQRLKDMENKDLPESSGCWFVRFMRRKLFRASIN